MEGSAVESDTLCTRVATYLRDHIAARALRPGDRLPSESEITRILGISRPIVREATRRLAALGLIEIANGRSPRVARLDAGVLQNVFQDALLTGQGDTRQILEVRRGIEVSMVRLAAERRTEAQAAELGRLIANMAERRHEPDAYTPLDMRFHGVLAEATANPFYVFLIDACRKAFQRSISEGLRARADAAERDRSHALHQAIFDAVRDADPDAASRAMENHFTDALGALLRLHT